MDNLEQSIKKNLAKLGLWLGLSLVALNVFSFYFITEISKSPVMFVAAPLIYSVIVPIILVIVLCLYGRKKIGGYWSFKQATTGIFTMFLIAYVIQTVGRDFLFARVIEPNMIEKTEKAFLNASAIIRTQPGANQKQLDVNEAEVKKSFEEQKDVTVGKVVQGIALSIIFTFVLALIFGALFKKDFPVYPASTD